MSAATGTPLPADVLHPFSAGDTLLSYPAATIFLRSNEKLHAQLYT